MVKLKCDWCGQPGRIIGEAKSLPGVKSAKCDVCHHEWETLVPESKVGPWVLQTEPTPIGKLIWEKVRNMRWK